MNNAVPAAAQHILAFIYKHEARSNYNTISSFKQHLLHKPITKMTVGELKREMQTWRKTLGTLSSAAGAPQIIYKTLLALQERLGFKDSQKFTPDFQDALAYDLLRQRGYDAFIDGRIDVYEFGKRIAMEWASMPVLVGTKNYKGQNIKRGQSFYAGDGLNAAGSAAAEFQGVLEAAKGLPGAVVAKPTPKPSTTAVTVGTGVAAGGAVIGGAKEATDAVTTLEPVLTLAGAITKYGPMVAGAIVLVVVSAIIVKKVWKG